MQINGMNVYMGAYAERHQSNTGFAKPVRNKCQAAENYCGR